MSKTVTIYGRSFTISGGEGDDYYRHIPDGADITDSVMAAIKPHVKPDSVCLDVGANIGLYALGLSHLAPSGRVYAFEPSPSAYGHLQSHLETNGRSEEHTSELQSQSNLVCRLLLEKK